MDLGKIMTGLILLQKNEIVKIQSLLRANKARDDYKTLGKWKYRSSSTNDGVLPNKPITSCQYPTLKMHLTHQIYGTSLFSLACLKCAQST